jgi:TetR/AcrR family transcriptional repressor of multidrug resistance operon
MRIRDENKIESIREKGLEMIVEQGFDGFSMGKLAKAANVSPATLYIYFKNREDLLNQLYMEVHKKFAEVALKDFNPDLSLKEGLKLQWKNRLKFITKYPVHYKFQEQFRNTPSYHSGNQLSEFKENMKQFVMNAIKRGEMKKMEPEIFWALAYGPFYFLVKFHLQGKSHMNTSFKLNDALLEKTLNKVINALKK